MSFLIDFLAQLISIFGIITAIGLILYLCQKLVFKICGGKAYNVVKYMGIIGTPIHELGHAFFCILFRHKIVDMKLFTPSNPRVLGYVSHSYKKKNPYQVIGNFFIGIGPIIFGTAVLSLLMFIIIPNVFKDYYSNIQALSDFNILNMFKHSFYSLKELFIGNYTNPWWYLFVFISFFIVLHMILSPEDIKGSLNGVILIILLLIIIDGILYLIKPSLLTSFTYYICIFGQYIFYFLLLSMAMSIFLVVITFILIGIPKFIIGHLKSKE